MSAENLASTILVVDDNEANRELARNTLEDEGYLERLPDGAVRIGIVHTNTEDQVERLLQALPR